MAVSNLRLSIILVFSLPLLAMQNDEVTISIGKQGLEELVLDINKKFENCLEHYKGDVDKSLNDIKTKVFDNISVDLHDILKKVYCRDIDSTNKISYYYSHYRDFDYLNHYRNSTSNHSQSYCCFSQGYCCPCLDGMPSDHGYHVHSPLNSPKEIVVLEDCTFEQALLKYAFNKAKKSRKEKRQALQNKVFESKVFEALDIQTKNALGQCVWPFRSFS